MSLHLELCLLYAVPPVPMITHHQYYQSQGLGFLQVTREGISYSVKHNEPDQIWQNLISENKKPTQFCLSTGWSQELGRDSEDAYRVLHRTEKETELDKSFRYCISAKP